MNLNRKNPLKIVSFFFENGSRKRRRINPFCQQNIGVFDGNGNHNNHNHHEW